MRDFVILFIILAAAPISLLSPYFGILVWSWISYFNPHRYAWGFAYNFPVAEVIAIPTLVGSLFSRKRLRSLFTREALLLILLWLWFSITTIHTIYVPEFAGHISDTKVFFEIISKILLMTLLTTVLVTSSAKLRYLLLVIALSFGVRSIAGALFVFKTGGEFRVYGPPDSFIEDNNAFALALNMTLPLLFYMAREERSRWLRYLLGAGFCCGIPSVLLTYSRGGLLGLAAVLVTLILKSRQKILGTIAILLIGVSVITFAPEQWLARMDRFTHGDLDGSARQRLVSWGFAWNFVHAYPFMGGGFQVFPDVALFQHYQPEPLPGGFLSTGPHSIYFQMLGEQGIVGLGLFIALLASSYYSLRRVRQQARGDDSAGWVINYSHMLEVSLVAYMVSGAFLGLAYFDLFYQLVACVVLLRVLYVPKVGWAAVDSAPKRAGSEDFSLSPEFAKT